MSPYGVHLEPHHPNGCIQTWIRDMEDRGPLMTVPCCVQDAKSRATSPHARFSIGTVPFSESLKLNGTYTAWP